MSDRYAEQRATDAFLDAMIRGHAEAAWAMMEIRSLVRTDQARPNLDATRGDRLRRIADKFRAAARHTEDALVKAERLP